ncbi:helix-turn-helix domain-containing protein [Candidatus Peregrinibacteria bacterium]|nr:helix-turn-helix domain-containing protein [Candidatus Peregrinibacteria bacterium]
MSNVSTNHIDREEASKVLRVSTRTLDRYLKKYRIKTRRDGRRILIKREDIDHIIHDHVGHFLDMTVDKSRQILEGVEGVQNVSKIEVKDVQIQNFQEKEKIMESDTSVYYDLYLEAKRELRERQDRLEAATYRVGQLETQLKNMVPLLDYTRKEKELREAHESMEKKVFEASVNLEKIERRLRTEKVAKWVYLSLVALLLIAEPILLMFWAFT